MAKLRIKLGALEVEYEGADDFMKSEVLPLIKALRELPTTPQDMAAPLLGKDQKTAMSTSTIAQKIGADSCGGLVTAALARLVLVSGHESVSRKAVLAEMQTATSYYRATYTGGNLSRTLKKLVNDGDLNEIGEDTYTLSEAKRKTLGGQFALK